MPSSAKLLLIVKLIEPVPSAALILVRDRNDGQGEILLVKRHSKSGFMPNTFVFPGGKHDDADENLKATAARETKEEISVSLAPTELLAWSHWITPSHSKRRFAAKFYIAQCPPHAKVQIDNHEIVDACWCTPGEALSPKNEKLLPPPQLRTLYELQKAGHKSAHWISAAHKRTKHITPYLPRRHKEAADPTLMLPWDPEYLSHGNGEALEMAADHPFCEGPSRFTRKDAAWHHHFSQPA